MSGKPDDEGAEDAVQPGHPSQAEGDDSQQPEHTDPLLNGHPSQAEGEDVDG